MRMTNLKELKFIKIEVFLGVLLALLFYGALSPSLASAEVKAIIETDEAAKLLGQPGVVVIDARRKPAYEAGHIPGALSMSFNLFRDPEDLAYKAKYGLLTPPEKAEKVFGNAGIDNNTRVIIYDSAHDDRPFGASLSVQMRSFGHDNIQLMRGGVEKWVKEGRAPLTKDVPAVTPKAFKAKPRPEMVATKDWILENADKVIFLDMRTFDEYVGLNTAGNPRGGHASGSYSTQWSDFAGKETIKSPQEMLAALKNSGAPISKDKIYVTYCNWGLGRGAAGYFYMKALGFDNVRVYGGSMEEWSKDMDLPYSTYEPGKLE